jgi:hypothetical protein
MANQPPLNPPQPRVEPPYLVIPTHIALPQRCIVTNEPVDAAEYQVWDLPYIPRWLVFLMFMGPFFMVTAPFVRKRCKFKAGLSKAVRRRRFWLRTLIISLIPLPFVCIGIAMVTGNEIWVIGGTVGFLLFYFSIPLLIIHAHPMRVRRHYGSLFWISGLSPEFLRELDESSKLSTT